MKKIVLASLMSSLSLSPFVYAGSMGDASCAPSGFVSFEGGYTWNKINGLEINIGTLSLSPVKKQDQLSGRIAGGIIHMLDDDIGITGELGWGYYGRTTFNIDSSFGGIPISISNKYTLSGFDALIGLAYIQTYYSLYVKVGGLIQNMQQNNTATGVFAGRIMDLNEKHTNAAVLPATKLAAAYNIDPNWSITGSWLFAYGATTKASFTLTTNPNVFVAKVNTQNPMMNTFMLGIQYTA